MSPRLDAGRPVGLRSRTVTTATLTLALTLAGVGSGVGAAASAAPMPSPANAASPPVIRTELGGPGSGPARNLSVAAFDVAVAGRSVVVADNGHFVVRLLDVRTGRSSVLAGTGVAGTSGDGGPARRAALKNPAGVVRSAAGVVYVADGNRVRAIGRDGVIRTVAGTSAAGFSGDGGPAAAARLHSVFGLALDASGNLYLADAGNHRIRMIDAGTGRIRTVAGDGNETASGDGGAATKAGMSPLNLLIAAGGDVLFTDFLNNRVRRISHGVVTTIAGNGTFGFSGDGGPATAAGLADPFGIASDAAGDLYIAEVDGVRRVASKGTISTLAGNGTDAYGGDGGPAAAAQVSDPQAVAANSAGDLYVADDLNCRIRRIDHRTKVVTTVAGTGICDYSGDGGPARLAELNRPRAVAVDAAGNLFIADTNNLRIREVRAGTGRISTVAGTGALGPAGDGGPATAAALDFPYGLAVDRAGDLAISQFRSHTVRVVSGRTGVIRTVAGTGRKSPLGDGGPATSAGLSWPRAVAYDPAGDLFVADTGHLRVRRVDARTGRISTVVGNGSSGFTGDGARATAASVASLNGLAIGRDGSIYLSDGDNHRIRRVRAGVIRTIAGDGSTTFSGDGGAATAAGIADAQGLAIDFAGVLHVCDASSGRVRGVRGLS